MAMKVVVVLPAGGCGERMGLTTPKQYCPVLQRPLMSHTINSFEKMEVVEKIILCVSSSKMAETEEIVKKYKHDKVHLVEAAATRHRSIFNGIKAITQVCINPDVVIIHDVVRPFVDENFVKTIASEAKKHGAAGAIRPLTSTVIATDADGFLDHALDRSKYRASEMPQAFTYDIIKTAYEKCSDHDLDFGTECLHLAQKYVYVKVRLVEGGSNLWKVTLKKDLYAAEGIIKEECNRVCLVGSPDKEFKDLLKIAVEKKHMKMVDKVEDANNMVAFVVDGEGYSNHIMEFNDNMTECDLRGTFVVIQKNVTWNLREMFWDFQEPMTGWGEMAEEYDCVATGIIISEESDLANIAETTATIIFERSKVNNGQTLMLFEGCGPPPRL